MAVKILVNIGSRNGLLPDGNFAANGDIGGSHNDNLPCHH